MSPCLGDVHVPLFVQEIAAIGLRRMHLRLRIGAFALFQTRRVSYDAFPTPNCLPDIIFGIFVRVGRVEHGKIFAVDACARMVIIPLRLPGIIGTRTIQSLSIRALSIALHGARRAPIFLR